MKQLTGQTFKLTQDRSFRYGKSVKPTTEVDTRLKSANGCR